MWRFLLPFVVAVCVVSCPAVTAQVTFLDPIPYLSAADSPFDFSGLGTSFFFEDFEDGDFDLPPGVATEAYALHPPSPITDSVDADDGTIDGLGRDGTTLRPDYGIVLPTNPPTWVQIFTLAFDQTALGFLPNHFGFAWTDGLQESGINLVVRFEDGSGVNRLYGPQMDNFNSGETSEDRFIGLRSTQPIRSVDVGAFFQSHVFIDQFEMDHVQFGFSVPEPVVSLGFCLLMSIISAHRIAGRITLVSSGCKELRHENRGLGGGQAEYIDFGRFHVSFG